jgi:hypothetical protein
MIIFSLSISLVTALTGLLLEKRAIIAVSYGIIIPLAIFLPRFVYKFDPKVRNVVNWKWVKKLEFFAFFIIILNAPGSLILHDLDFQYDRFLHLFSAFFAFIIFFLLWLPVLKIKGKKIEKRSFLLFVLITLFIALFFWEALQSSIDMVFGTKLFFDKSQTIEVDFSEDICFGLLGLAAALIYSDRYFEKITLAIWK